MPDEPAAWANLGLAHLRLGEFDAAAAPIAKAAALAPRQSDVAVPAGPARDVARPLDEGIAALSPRRRSRRGQPACAIRAGGRDRARRRSECRRRGAAAVRADPQGAARQSRRRARARAAGGEARRRRRAPGFGPAARHGVGRLAGAGGRTVSRAAGGRRGAELHRTPPAASRFCATCSCACTVFRESLAAVRTPTELIAEPFERFLKLPSPSPNPSPRDEPG